jgi:hypothetical protein
MKQTHIYNFVVVGLTLTFGRLAFGQVCVTSTPGVYTDRTTNRLLLAATAPT